MSAAKNFPFLPRENSRIQFRRYLQSVQEGTFQQPNTSLASSVFGKITSAGAARQVQLALRFEF